MIIVGGPGSRLSRLLSHITRTGETFGTYEYCAPEQLSGDNKGADKRTDVYQLGKVLYQMVAGKSPLLIDDSGIPPTLAYIIQHATHQNRDQRYQTIDELMDAVSDYMFLRDADHDQMFENALLSANMDLERERYDPNLLQVFFNVLVQLKDDPITLLE